MSVSGSNQGVRFGVATSTNRPSTPFDGQVIYETDTDRIMAYDGTNWIPQVSAGTIDAKGDLLVGTAADTVARLAVGATNGHVLTVDSGETAGMKWATTGAGLVVVKAETSFSASSSVTADSVFTSTYTNYMMTITATTSTTSTVRLRWRTSGSSNTTSNYNFTTLRVQSSGVFGGASASQDRMDLHEGGQTNPYSGVMFIYSPQTATRTQVTTNFWNNNASATAYQTSYFAGNFAADTQFDGIEIYPSTGTMTGSYTIYGLAKA